MSFSIKVSGNATIPLYQQIVDGVCRAVRDGKLAPGEKLPTVRELADRMGLARGTIKRAYDELEKQGIIRMTQGRGTFVTERQEEPGGRKERAMKAIDNLLDELEALSFSPREMQIFLDLKLRARVERNAGINIAAVDCNPEALAMMASQLSFLPGVDVYRFLLSDLQRGAYRISGNMDLVVTTYNHSEELEKLVEDPARILRVVMAPARETVIQLAQVKPGQRLGLLGASERFSQIMRAGCQALTGREHLAERGRFGSGEGLEVFLEDKDVLILPPHYMEIVSAPESELIQDFGRRKTVIEYRYQLDAGSFKHLEERIEKIRLNKRANPGG